MPAQIGYNLKDTEFHALLDFFGVEMENEGKIRDIYIRIPLQEAVTVDVTFIADIEPEAVLDDRIHHRRFICERMEEDSNGKEFEESQGK